MNTPTVSTLDMRVIERVLEMEGGYVLDFTNSTFAAFFAEHGVNIDDPRYAVEGHSKAKRLRYFLRIAPAALAGPVLASLLEHRLGCNPIIAASDISVFRRIASRLGGSQSNREPLRKSTTPSLDGLLERFNHLTAKTDRQAAGIEFELLLSDLFQAFDLAPEEPFRVAGEQMDGAFKLDGEFYLLEAKWVAERVGSKELYAFREKISGKSDFTRGAFISVSGFTSEALEAIVRGKVPKFLMLDGAHIFRVLSGGARLDELLRESVRALATRGVP